MDKYQRLKHCLKRIDQVEDSGQPLTEDEQRVRSDCMHMIMAVDKCIENMTKTIAHKGTDLEKEVHETLSGTS